MTVAASRRPIPNLEGYEASEEGLIYFRGRPVKLTPTTTGYLCFRIAGRLASVHRLVCEAFHGPAPEGKPLVRHLNDQGHDNRPENLAWGNQSENMYDRVRLGNHPAKEKTHCPQGHEYSEVNTYYRPGCSSRYCRECGRESRRARSKRGLPAGDRRHGSTTGYAYGCRCEVCKSARQEYRLRARAEGGNA